MFVAYFVLLSIEGLFAQNCFMVRSVLATMIDYILLDPCTYEMSQRNLGYMTKHGNVSNVDIRTTCIIRINLKY